MAATNNGDAFNYQLLGRLQQDCEYYLGAGARNKKHLWALDEAEQIQKMKELYAGLPEKPEWITLADIERYEAALTRPEDSTPSPAADGHQAGETAVYEFDARGLPIPHQTPPMPKVCEPKRD